MKKMFWLWVVLLLWATPLLATPKKEVQHLKTLAQVWGFLKYYHPEAAKGNPDWDQELLKMIPLVQKASSTAGVDTLLTQWYASLPTVWLAPHLTQAQNDSTKRVFSEKDVQALQVPKEMKAKLLDLYQRHLPDSSKYITNRYKEYTLDYILHLENGFDQPAYPDEAHRLLALFRYWNIIQYFYPHKATAAPHWDKVLTKYIPLFRQAQDARAYQRTFLQLTAELKDSHSFFTQPDWDKEYNQLDLPFRVYYAQGKYYIGESRYDSLMQIHDFRIGDQIIGINGQTIRQRIKELTPLTTGTNRLSFRRNLGNALFKIGSEAQVQVTLKRGKERLQKQVSLYTGAALYRHRLRNKPVLWQQVQPGVWHVKICTIASPDTLQRLFQDIRSAKAVIWDLRDYPSYQVVQAVSCRKVLW